MISIFDGASNGKIGLSIIVGLFRIFELFLILHLGVLEVKVAKLNKVYVNRVACLKHTSLWTGKTASSAEIFFDWYEVAFNWILCWQLPGFHFTSEVDRKSSVEEMLTLQNVFSHRYIEYIRRTSSIAVIFQTQQAYFGCFREVWGK